MKKQIGFTLLELMITLIIFGTIVGAAVPKLQSLLERSSIESLTPLFERSLKYARDEAIGKNLTVQILPREVGSDWSQGWKVQYITLGGAVEDLRSFDPLPGSPTFTSTDFSTTNPIKITGTGQVEETGDILLYYPGCTGTQKIQFSLLISGILKKSKIAC